MSYRYGLVEDGYSSLIPGLHRVFGAGFALPAVPAPFADQTTPFYSAVLDSVDTRDMVHLRAIVERAGEKVPQWFFVEKFDDRLSISGEVADSQVICFSAVLEAAMRARVEINKIDIRGDVLLINGLNGLLAEIRPIRFETVDRDLEQRVLSAFKGVAVYETDRLARRLNSIPGLECLVGDRGATFDRLRSYEYSAYGSATNIAAALRRGLSRHLNLHLSVSRVQEGLARAVGVGSWAELIALEARTSVMFVPLQLRSLGAPVRELDLFYLTPAQAFAGLASHLRGLSWKDPLQIHLIGPSIFVSAAENERRSEQHNNAPCLEPLSEIYQEDETLEFARKALRGAMSLSDLTGVRARPGQSKVPIDQSRNHENAKILYLGELVFTRYSDGINCEYLRGERVDQNGEGLESMTMKITDVEIIRGDGIATLRHKIHAAPMISLHGLESDEILMLDRFIEHRFRRHYRAS